MGCGEDKISTEENAFVTSVESELWSPLPCTQVETAFYKSMREGQLSIDKLAKLSKSLGLRFPPALLSALTLDQVVDIDRLFRLVLLLSVGTTLEKGAALWDWQDAAGSEEMSKGQVEAFIVALTNSALDYVSPLVGAEPQIGKQRLETWLGVLRSKKGKYAKDMANLYLNGGEKVQKHQFLSVLRANAQADVTNPTIIRSRLEEIKAIPPKFANAFSARAPL